MKQFTNGTSALADSMCWNLCKLGSADEMASYELRAQGTADAQAPEIMMHVISGLLGGMQVGVIAECGEAGMPALSGLSGVWHDGRMLKRGQGGAFVALDPHFGELESDGLEPCVGAGAAFRFLGFDSHVLDDTVFRSLLGGDTGAEIEVSCRDFADSVLSIRLDAEKVDETEALSGISRAVSECGCFLQIDL
ncbi:MAG: hypothetical protein KHW93_02940 [Butyricicoccus pullicaecorum]|nr:hypothetical protein [Butyricicoccus pullicaecorum]